MKLTAKHLKQVIQEEVKRVLSERYMGDYSYIRDDYPPMGEDDGPYGDDEWLEGRCEECGEEWEGYEIDLPDECPKCGAYNIHGLGDKGDWFTNFQDNPDYGDPHDDINEE